MQIIQKIANLVLIFQGCQSPLSGLAQFPGSAALGPPSVEFPCPHKFRPALVNWPPWEEWFKKTYFNPRIYFNSRTNYRICGKQCKMKTWSLWFKMQKSVMKRTKISHFLFLVQSLLSSHYDFFFWKILNRQKTWKKAWCKTGHPCINFLGLLQLISKTG